MKSWINCELRGLVFGALSVVSVTGCSANVDDAQEETTATTGERITVTGSAYRWNTGEGPKIMGPVGSTFCFLTELYGKFGLATDSVYITDNGANWILHGAGNQSGAFAHGAGARCVTKTNTAKKIWHWPQQNSDGSLNFGQNELWSASTSACYLTGLGGNFKANTDFVRTRIHANGKWVLEGSTSSLDVHADATCVPGVSTYDNPGGVTGEDQFNSNMVPSNIINPTTTSPVACGLTQIGGALGTLFPFIPSPAIVLTEIPLPPDQHGVSPGWRWRLSVNKPGFNLSANTRCFP